MIDKVRLGLVLVNIASISYILYLCMVIFSGYAHTPISTIETVFYIICASTAFSGIGLIALGKPHDKS